MFSIHKHSRLRNHRYRRRKSKSKSKSNSSEQPVEYLYSTNTDSSLINCFHTILNDLKRPGSRFLSYNITKLKPICRKIALQQMSTTKSKAEPCPFICIFCQNLIYEPITIYCGHTFCAKCINDEQISSKKNCPRCPDDVEEQCPSPIVHAVERNYKNNNLIKELFERSDTIKGKYNIVLKCHQGKLEYSNGNYQQAIDIYSQILAQYDDEHFVLYNRAKAYTALKQYDQALVDATKIIALKPQWPKGYLCQSEILFEIKQFAAALMSSLKALVIEPDDQLGKQIMARHLHAVLHNSDDQESVANMDSELQRLNMSQSLQHDSIETNSPERKDDSLTICKSTNLTNSCFCSQFDYKKLNVKDFDCPVCVNLLWFPITTPCGHVFCRECLIRSVDNTQIQCPLCKSCLTEFFPKLLQSHVNKTEVISKMIETYFPAEYNERRQLYEQETIRGTAIPESVNNNNEITSFEIPIFVCVLALPYCACPLHVFEPRYRLMMRRAIATESRSFGMCIYDEETRTFADYGTLLYIRGIVYTQDGRSIVDTVGQRRFRVLDRGMRDRYCTARVELIRDQVVEQHEFNDLFQMNRDTYTRVQNWFNQLAAFRRSLIMQNIDEYPDCDDLTENSTDGPQWVWIILNLLPIDQVIQYTALASTSLRIRLQIINDTIDFLSNRRQQSLIQMISLHNQNED